MGSDTDISTSSARAYASALNKLITLQMRRMTHESEIMDPTGINGAVAVEVGAPSVVVA